jgi:hypothetical protein
LAFFVRVVKWGIGRAGGIVLVEVQSGSLRQALTRALRVFGMTSWLGLCLKSLTRT